MSNTFVKNAFFYRTNAAPERPTNLPDSSQEQDLLRESVNAIREELGSFSCDRDAGRLNNDELESSAIIPTVQFFDSCDGKCEDEPHFARSAELLKSTDAVGMELGSIATMMDSSRALMDGAKAARDGAEAAEISPAEQKYRNELSRFNACIVQNTFFGGNGACVAPDSPRDRGYDYRRFHYRQRENYYFNKDWNRWV